MVIVLEVDWLRDELAVYVSVVKDAHDMEDILGLVVLHRSFEMAERVEADLH